MSDRARALFLSPEAPYPLTGGGALRSAGILEYLARNYSVDVVAFRQPGAADPNATRLGEIAQRVHTIELPFHSRQGIARVARNLVRIWKGIPPLTDRFHGFQDQLSGHLQNQPYALAVIEHFWCAGYAQVLRNYAQRIILDLHNIESVLHERCAASERWPLTAAHRRFGRESRRLERLWFPGFSQILVTSEADASTACQISPTARVGVYPNTIPFIAVPALPEEDEIVFSANMEYHPNTAAVRFFAQQVWPELRRQWPGLRWKLTGKNPDAVRSIVAGDRNIRLEGPVDDAISAIAKARVAVVPMLAGSGTRVKILEAWAAGTPVVSTSIGAEGLPCADGKHLLIADDPVSFATAVSRLLRSLELRRHLAGNARDLFEREFTWEAGWVKLSKLGI